MVMREIQDGWFRSDDSKLKIHKSQPPQMAHYHMRRSAISAGRPDNRNYLESGEVRGDMGGGGLSFFSYRESFASGRCLSFHFVCLSFPVSPNNK